MNSPVVTPKRRTSASSISHLEELIHHTITQTYIWAAVQTEPDGAWEFSHILQVVNPLCT